MPNLNRLAHIDLLARQFILEAASQIQQVRIEYAGYIEYTHPIRLFHVSVLKSPDALKLSKAVLHIQLATIHKLVLIQKQIKIVQQHANV